MIKIFQEKNAIYINGDLEDAILQINYKGNLVGSTTCDAKVIVRKKVIFIYDITDVSTSEPFMYYHGNIQLTKCQYLKKDLEIGIIPVIHKKHIYRDMNTTWSNSNSLWKDYSYGGNRLYDNLKTTIDYTYKGKDFRSYKYRLSDRVNLHGKEQEVLNDINKIRGVNEFTEK